MANTASQWAANKNTIVNAVNNGTASAQQIAWYNKWQSLGSPSSQQQMWAAQNTTTAPPAVVVTQQDSAQAAAQTPRPAQQPPQAMSAQQPPQGSGMLAEEPKRDVWHQRYIDRGVIDEQGNILKPEGINTAALVRDTPDWAKGNETLLRQAYLLNFEAQARNGNVGWDTQDSADYRNFIDMGFDLTPEERQSIGNVGGQSMGHNDSLTFGGGQPTTGVAIPTPAQPTRPAVSIDPNWQDSVETYQMTNRGAATPFLDAYMNNRPAQPQGFDPRAGDVFPQSTQPQGMPIGTLKATPFLDSYMRTREQQQKQGPVTGLFSKELGGV
jgi:hypothetical protein